jgi:hypothetical protein
MRSRNHDLNLLPRDQEGKKTLINSLSPEISEREVLPAEDAEGFL